MLRVLIVDDERMARERISLAVATMAGVREIGQASDAREAIMLVMKEKPDVVLLDIEMPGASGFDVVREALEEGAACAFIFVTAYDQYTIEAFEHEVADYLLKPVAFERLKKALDRAEKHLSLRSAEERAERLAALLASMEEGSRQEKDSPCLWVKVSGAMVRVPVETIQRVSADRDYVRIVTATDTHHSRSTMASIEKELAGSGMIRVHRSHIVRKGAIRRWTRRGPNRRAIELDDGTLLPVGSTFFGLIDEIMAEKTSGR
ncbi:response regulator transcription factor [Parvularcula sp. ZS-1/3]|uniref:Response regulator transcription factor n=1 Tax=Parvularcula mediterranea TaxID=2732508 RepID=A0A7Y3W5P9_9PROT|nr:LytTR family DNA-binding domain-containing protein [Parvularcula mediterranea]NNU16854.1 response regulator transcription factor [Parvularcula mediterranea]